MGIAQNTTTHTHIAKGFRNVGKGPENGASGPLAHNRNRRMAPVMPSRVSQYVASVSVQCSFKKERMAVALVATASALNLRLPDLTMARVLGSEAVVALADGVPAPTTRVPMACPDAGATAARVLLIHTSNFVSLENARGRTCSCSAVDVPLRRPPPRSPRSPRWWWWWWSSPLSSLETPARAVDGARCGGAVDPTRMWWGPRDLGRNKHASLRQWRAAAGRKQCTATYNSATPLNFAE